MCRAEDDCFRVFWLVGMRFYGDLLLDLVAQIFSSVNITNVGGHLKYLKFKILT